MPNLVEIGQTAAEILRFFKMAAAAILNVTVNNTHKIHFQKIHSSPVS